MSVDELLLNRSTFTITGILNHLQTTAIFIVVISVKTIAKPYVNYLMYFLILQMIDNLDTHVYMNYFTNE